MSREIVNNSESDRAIPAESNEQYDLEMKILELQSEINTLQPKKKYYKTYYRRFKNERDQIRMVHRDLKEALERLEHQVGKAHQKIKKQEEIIDHKTEQIIALNKQMCAVHRRMRQALDEKQAQVESLEALQLDNFAPKPEELLFPALEPPPDVVPTQENLGPQPEDLDSPVSEPSPDVFPTSSGSWRHGAKRLLKIGLGVAAVGLIIPAAYWLFKA